jgi:hypothetical protein
MLTPTPFLSVPMIPIFRPSAILPKSSIFLSRGTSSSHCFVTEGSWSLSISDCLSVSGILKVLVVVKLRKVEVLMEDVMGLEQNRTEEKRKRDIEAEYKRADVLAYSCMKME